MRSAGEAAAALAGGADIVDIKEPRAGPLGDAGAAIRSGVASAVRATIGAGTVLVSAALGELDEAADPASFRGDPGVAIYKLALAGLGGRPDWPSRLGRWQDRLAAIGAQLVPAAYADHASAAAPAPEELLGFCATRGLRLLLLDTWRKPGRLLGLWSGAQVRDLVAQAAAARVQVVLAGSIAAADVPRLAALEPFAIGVRGAACRDGRRDAPLDEERVRQLSQVLHQADVKGS